MSKSCCYENPYVVTGDIYRKGSKEKPTRNVLRESYWNVVSQYMWMDLFPKEACDKETRNVRELIIILVKVVAQYL